MKEFELEPGEHVVRAARKHWFLFVVELIPYAVFAILPFAIPGTLRLFTPLAPFADFFDFTSPFGRATIGIWLLVTWTGAWGAFTRYFLNVWVLTNQRIVDVKQHGYFNREVSSILLNRVQDVTTEVEGVLPSLLGIGDITVQSAGAVDEFHMHGIPRPEQMRDIILKYVSNKPDTAGV